MSSRHIKVKAANQMMNLVLDTVRLARKKEKKRAAVQLQLHSGQGGPYTSQEYFVLTERYGIAPSYVKTWELL